MSSHYKVTSYHLMIPSHHIILSYHFVISFHLVISQYYSITPLAGVETKFQLRYWVNYVKGAILFSLRMQSLHIACTVLAKRFLAGGRICTSAALHLRYGLTARHITLHLRVRLNLALSTGMQHISSPASTRAVRRPALAATTWRWPMKER